MDRLVHNALSSHDVLFNKSQPEPPPLPFTITNAPPPQTPVHVKPATREFRILSLDGGGVRGLFTVIVLEVLMEEIRILTKHDDDIRPCDFFDLIGGTSTGGLLAVMLSRLRMDLISCKKQYRELSKTIFQKQGWSYPFKTAVDAWLGRAWYPAEPLEASIKAVVTERIRVLERKELRCSGQKAEEAPLRSNHVSRARCFVCAIRGGERGCARLRSYISKSGEGDRICTIWQACRATSAAQLYFPPMKIGDETYWDGGSESNNPVQETYEEAFLEFGDEPPLAGIVSIGTGLPAHKDPGTEARAAVDSFIARATDTESIHLAFKRQHPQLKDVYFRLQGSLELGAIDLADWTKLDVIERLAYEYLESNDGRLAIEKCARQLI
jgi:predicted acylesterase/phospholipase RssA